MNFWFWPFKRRDKLNTVYLTGDMDDVEILEDIEKTFGIKFLEFEAKNTITVGDLEGLVRSKFLENNKDDALWKLVCRIVRYYSGHKGPIDRETTFFADDAKARMKNG